MSEYEVDLTKPPLPPPTRTMKDCWFGCYETKESIARRKRYKQYAEDYKKELDKGD